MSNFDEFKREIDAWSRHYDAAFRHGRSVGFSAGFLVGSVSGVGLTLFLFVILGVA